MKKIILTAIMLSVSPWAMASDKSDRCFAGEQGTKLQVAGAGSTSLGHPYRLKVDWYPDSEEAKAIDALLIFAEPSHDLVMAHFVREPNRRDLEEIRSLSPEMTTMIDAGSGESHMLGELEKGLTGSQGFSVSSLRRGQIDTLIGESAVPVGSFGLAYLFPSEESSGYKVCCTCSDCHKCTTCVSSPPSASCTCGGCAIDCRD